MESSEKFYQSPEDVLNACEVLRNYTNYVLKVLEIRGVLIRFFAEKSGIPVQRLYRIRKTKKVTIKELEMIAKNYDKLFITRDQELPF